MTPFTESVWQPVPATNPFAVLPDAVTMRLWLVAGAWFALGAVVGTAALLVRYRRASATERGRLLLVLPLAVAVPPALLLSQLGAPGGGGAEMVTVTLLAVAVVATMLRHGVLDVDVVLNRALVYGLLAASLVGAYVADVVLVAAAVGQRTSWLPPAVAAGVTALALQPLLHRLRFGVTRLLYGDRATPDVVVQRVRVAGDGVAGNAASDVLSAAAAELTPALRVPWARIEIEGDVGQAGTIRTAGRALPLVHGGEAVGTLTVGARWDGERPSPAVERALRAVTRQLGTTVHALLLARRLAGARERLVTAREDERRRIRRDLHDGLGPALAGLSLGLEGAEELAKRDADAAVALLGELRSQAEHAVSDVRRVVEGLRPPALDDLGLAGAVEAELARLASPRLAVRLDVPAELPDLSAAVEVAALRIVGEAAHNVCRHADAATCRVRLAVQGRWLTVRVEDDGTGIAAGTVPHVGLDSMVERAEEVGGRLEVTTGAGTGTVVAAWLPVGAT
jgi:signal transduction histidine kinase